MANETNNQSKLPKQVVRDISAIASEAAVTAYQEELNKTAAAFKDKRLHNTKLLIKKYAMLRDYSNNAIYDTAQMLSPENSDVLTRLGLELGESHKVDSIRNNVIKTKVIMEHVDTMLDCYKARCEKSSKPEIKRRWRVLHRMYLDTETMAAQDVADLEHISLSMVYLDIDSACEELSPLFFGLDLSTFWL